MNFQFFPATSHLLISVPHAGTALPSGLVDRLTPQDVSYKDTDWHVDRLYAFARDNGASLLIARNSRYVVDLNRPSDDKLLYQGAGTGLVPLTTFSGEPLYPPGREPNGTEQAGRVREYWQPYHDQLTHALGEIRQRHGHAVLLDGHSILSRVPRLFEGRLPDLNLGTNNGASCHPALAERAWSVLSQASGFTAVRDGRFRGGYITRHYGRPDDGLHALQLEIAQACYMDETRPENFDEDRAAPLIGVLRRLVKALLDWQP